MSGALKRCDAACAPRPAGWAHSEQNLAVTESVAPQLVQLHARRVAHSSQNFAPGRF